MTRSLLTATLSLANEERCKDYHTLELGFGFWLAGFLDGEGHFGIYRYNCGKGNWSYGTRCSIVLRDDDSDLLERVRAETSLGRIYKTHKPNAPLRYSRWDVRRRSECLSLVKILDAYPLQSKKQRDYEIWRMAVLLWQRSVRGTGKAGRPNEMLMSKMATYKSQLEAVRIYPVAA